MNFQEESIRVLTIDEIILDNNILFLLDCKDFYEELENYEYCVKIRDRITELKKIQNKND